MKKHLALVMAALMMASMLAGCGSSETTDTGSGDGNSEGYNTLNIIAAHGAAENTSENESFLKFKELVEERSGGAVTVDLYPNQQLGGDREYTEAATQGNVTMGGPSTANIAPFVPAMNAFETPFLFSDRETVYAALDSEAGQALLDSLESAGLKGLGYFENGFRQLTTNKEINSLADLKGLKIRVMENEVHLAIWEALGANPSPLAFGELYSALQQKAFDAQENPAELIYNTKFYEVQDHVYLTNHIYTPYIIYMNLDTWNSLNEQTQTLIQECMDEAVAYCREICEENEQACFDAINESGKSQTYEVSDELHNEMVTACKDAGIYDLVIEKAGGTYAQDLWAAAGFDPESVA
ncbi:MAG: TRAP transporter substrate-binding protein [Dysosmobacter sp.]|nr:TRAP transporter substrate-binding protein [uncultured Oscillibacter sp.]